jgi:hypothetical protein
VTILTQFVFRLSFGLAVALGVTPPRLVTSGFYRVHLWVLMGLNTLAALAVFSYRHDLAKAASQGDSGALVVDPLVIVAVAVAAAAASYAGSVLWLYERPRAGVAALYLVGLLALMGAELATPWSRQATPAAMALALADLASSGLLLGTTLAAMLLGHWYLNTPTMELVPLERLLMWMILAVIARTVLCAVGLSLELSQRGTMDSTILAFLVLRWLSGLIGTLAMAILARQTLRIPNTQSATGILYVGVVLAFMGELISLLLSVQSFYPL